MRQNQHKQPRAGIDIGRVIMAPVKGGRADTSFLSGTFERAMQTPPSPGAFEGVRTLVQAFSDRVWLVSKCGPNIQRKTRQWFREWDFFAETGLAPQNVRFCLKRPEKANHCRELAITHFVDDRLDVLEHLRNDVPHLYLFGEQPSLKAIPYWVTHVADWPTTVACILEDLNSAFAGAEQDDSGAL